MFAIVATSGKQFRVTEGDRIVVDRVSADVGQTVRLAAVLMLGGDSRPMVGTPFVEGAAVEATVVAHRAGDKLIVFKFEARKRRRRKLGHRQQLSELRIGAIHPPGNGEQKAAAGVAPASDEADADNKPRAQTGARRSRKTADKETRTTEE
jgi:large subunit ribosomal protein L21